MKTTPILKVTVLADGRTAVFPESKRADYQYVYREAAGVYWDQTIECFISTPPREWTPPQWYRHIIAIVRSGVGLDMILDKNTIYDSDHEDFEASIKIADQDLRG